MKNNAFELPIIILLYKEEKKSRAWEQRDGGLVVSHDSRMRGTKGIGREMGGRRGNTEG